MKGMRPLTKDEVKLISDSFSGKFEHRDRALFLLGVKSGFRITELLSLKIGDIVDNGKMVDRVHVSRANMKKKVEGRSVILHPEAKEALRIWIGELKDMGYMAKDDFIFQSRKGGNKAISRVGAWQILNAAAEGLEIGNIGTHSMRKTFANNVHDNMGNDIVKTQRALGHKNINSTVSYLSFREEDIDEAILNC